MGSKHQQTNKQATLLKQQQQQKRKKKEKKKKKPPTSFPHFLRRPKPRAIFPGDTWGLHPACLSLLGFPLKYNDLQGFPQKLSITFFIDQTAAPARKLTRMIIEKVEMLPKHHSALPRQRVPLTVTLFSVQFPTT